MSVDGIGPSTSVLSGQRSTTELHTHELRGHYQQLHTQKNNFLKNITEILILSKPYIYDDRKLQTKKLLFQVVFLFKI